MTHVYGFTMRDIDGKDVSLSAFRGKALLMVNVASKCGFTGQSEREQKSTFSGSRPHTGR